MKIFKWILRSFYLCLPLAFYFHHQHNQTLTFLFSALAIIPLAAMMGHATEALAARVGSGLGALLNASLGNAAELIIAVIALQAGQLELVKASITGSIIGNILFVLGLSIFLGGLRRKEQTFSRTAAESGVGMLYIAVLALSIPSIVNYVSKELGDSVLILSQWTAVILLLTYVAGLIFTFITHKHVYQSDQEEEHGPKVSGRRIALELIVSAVLIGVLAEFLVGTIEHASTQLGLSQIFVGVIVVAVVGNAAEHAAAVVFAIKNKMNLTINIAIESSKQLALFVAPALVLVGWIAGISMDLSFTPLEAAALGGSVIILAMLVLDGRTNWLEGVQLLSVYAILALAFYFAT